MWYVDVASKRCVRVREGGEALETIELDRGCFACMLGGAGRTTLLMLAAIYDPATMFTGAGTSKVIVAAALALRAGWPSN